jgi:glycerol-3-phosphate dehydrogenase
MQAARYDSIWELTLEHRNSASRKTIRARTMVNAAGPWVEKVLTEVVGAAAKAKIRLVQGSHIVVPRHYEHDRAYVLQNADSRIIFVIPYLDGFTLIGTTDRDYAGEPADVRATDADVAYLCEAASQYFAKPITPGDVVWSFSGVRPLYDDGATEAKAATRDYVFELNGGHGDTPPLLSIFGGKITTYRRLAEHAIEQLQPFLPASSARASATRAGWTASAPLPGGDFASGTHGLIEARLAAQYPFLSTPLVQRFVRSYGTRSADILGHARTMEDLGHRFGADLTEVEVCHLMKEEWAQTAEDILWRRTKLGLQFSKAEVDALQAWMTTAIAARATG